MVDWWVVCLFVHLCLFIFIHLCLFIYFIIECTVYIYKKKYVPELIFTQAVKFPCDLRLQCDKIHQRNTVYFF